MEHDGESGGLVPWGSGEISVSLDTDAVTPAGVTVLPEGRRMYLLPIPRGVPGETLGRALWVCSGSSVVFVAHLLEGAAWFAALRSARLVVGLFRRAQRLQVFSVFRRTAIVGFLSLLFSFFVSFGLAVLFAPAVVSCLYRLVAILI